jgi:DNA polymerase-3 subunit delta'
MQSIIGQDTAISILQNALDSGRFHHAWLFHGPSGVGKFTTAVAVARRLLCHDPQQNLTGAVEACGACRSCRAIDNPQAVHPDFHVIRKELAGESQLAELRSRKQMNIPVDLLRELMIGGWVGGSSRRYVESHVSRTAQWHRGKVFIIDEAELLAPAGQNALLKTLEEPPDQTWIILVSSQEQWLLPTIRSRCQRVSFGLLDDPSVARWVEQYLETRDQDLDTEHQHWVVRFARGSLGRAELAIRYGLHAWQQTLEPLINQMARGQRPAELGGALAGMVESFSQEWVKAQPQASKDAANKAGVRHVLGLMGELCREQIRHQHSDHATRADQENAIAAWLDAVDLLVDAEAELGANVSPALLLDNLVVKWSHAASG